ncbi:hypothetical protein A3H22_01535 [Candidatus Peribacteria bacterium RIFCSPLOWO2_12_FULL_55_15]|nr:MAG: hypothetical protein A2789_00465 [Candidatus Peribacteria bacterium RIFCSPHIGHO2_01_FULL_54_22]OGJ62156.1 MAG: hypothetical protein A3D12_00395 [Candidatus Peribacteria bacterium RIFCSPHIGHO2_02_FULL_55_24]OGJ67935.1 MAG: hypothetical protein A2947_04050 [Candidatus Peribacteria bacterium RIFCSPLOWO2_01_FULL_54_110]OGJ69453.1 MAG: hypothetical protein A3H90_02660 [Candidatus Peribacteria bacterium RIFCSPLOWO2_02_FULL_55_36]OGJ71797.1 MAG: hypothetical protein A3H22_01535 [Candidatus Per
MSGRAPWSFSLSPLVLVILLTACTQQPDNLHPLTLISTTGERIDLRIEIADDPTERSRGLMFREKLPAGQGMLFVFEEPQTLSFWMKNTMVPLDILFFDAEGQFVSTTTMEQCDKDPCPLYSSAAEAQYALEVPVGFVKHYNIGKGWTFHLPASRPISPASSF